jgi:hypothetical protein
VQEGVYFTLEVWLIVGREEWMEWRTFSGGMVEALCRHGGDSCDRPTLPEGMVEEVRADNGDRP